MTGTRDWEKEDVNRRIMRASYAEEQTKEGKSYKHAWFLAFQKFPRVIKDEDTIAKGNFRTLEVDTETSSDGETPSGNGL